MRWCVSIGAVLVAGAMAGGDVAGVAAPNPATQLGLQLAARETHPSVDVELVLAVDVSYSMDMDELALQREGYAQAIVSKEFLLSGDRVLIIDDFLANGSALQGLIKLVRDAVRQMVEDRATSKRLWGKGSLAEQAIKVATNSCYGKLAQDVAERQGWNAWAEEMESIGGSAVTSPYHAAMITSLVRALLLGMANEISMISTTTDGFITPEPDVEGFDCFGNAEVFRASREALVGDPEVWEVKHQQDDLVNLTTRGNVSLYGQSIELTVYNNNSPFENRQLTLIAFVESNTLFAHIDHIK